MTASPPPAGDLRSVRASHRTILNATTRTKASAKSHPDDPNRIMIDMSTGHTWDATAPEP